MNKKKPTAGKRSRGGADGPGRPVAKQQGPSRRGKRTDSPRRSESTSAAGPSRTSGAKNGRTNDSRTNDSRTNDSRTNDRRTPRGVAPRGGSQGPVRGRTKAAKRGLGGDQVEGRQAVRELFLAGNRRVREVYLIDELEPADILSDIVELARDVNVPVKAVSRRHFDMEALTESHQGVLARADELQEYSLDDLATAPGAFLLVLDGITDPGNLGAILRTAECAGVTGVVLPKHRAVHISPTVTKTAAGAIEHLPMAVVGGIPATIARLTELDVLTVGLEAGAETTIFGLPIDRDTRVALVLGAEGDGLGRLVRERVDVLAAIPLRGRLNSLNVAMAGAVACFEVVRRREAGAGAATQPF